MKNKFRFNGNLLYLIIGILVILMLFFVQQEKKVKVEEVTAEEGSGSGFLEIETFPSDAEIFVDNAYRGKSPITLYDIPTGSHNVVIKKDGYEDFESDADIKAGRKTFLEARLAVKVVEEKEKKDIAGEKEEIQETSKGNEINIGNKFSFYYDFSEGEFADKRKPGSDVFSKRFDSYLVFTIFQQVNIKTINKKIENVNKEDCVEIKGTFEYLHSGRSLCIITKEGKIAAIGGYWENTENANLSWKVFD